jgi:hypothetical protein
LGRVGERGGDVGLYRHGLIFCLPYFVVVVFSSVSIELDM